MCARTVLTEHAVYAIRTYGKGNILYVVGSFLNYYGNINSVKMNTGKPGQQFKEVLDVHISRMSEHLTQFQDAAKPLFACLSPPFDASQAREIAALFPPTEAPDPLALEAELQVLVKLCTEESTFSKIKEISEANKHALPLANRVIRFVLTAPVTVASNERSFSRLKFVKNYLRTSMTDARLEGLILLACEKDLTDQVDIDEVAKKWSLLKKRRIKIH